MPKPTRAGGNGIFELRGRNQAAVVRKAEILFENGHPAKNSAWSVRKGIPVYSTLTPVKDAESVFSRCPSPTYCKRGYDLASSAPGLS